MDNKILSILVCPECSGRLIYDSKKNILVCKADKLAYPIIDDIPFMVRDKAVLLKLEELDKYE